MRPVRPEETMEPVEWKPEDLELVPCCPVCGSEFRQTFYDKLADRVWGRATGLWTMESCGECKSGYLNPRPRPESIAKAYRLYYTHTASTPGGDVSPSTWLHRLRRSLRNGYINRRLAYSLTPASETLSHLLACCPGVRADASHWFRHLHRPQPGDTLLDIGCGDGLFLTIMRQYGWEVRGLEPDPEAARAAQSRGLNIDCGMLTPGRYASESFAAITLGHVLEHLHDPMEVLKECYKLLKPGGKVWIATPNLESFGHAKFGADWVHLDPPRHLVLFTANSLTRAMQAGGFSVESLGPVLRDEVFTWTASYSLRGGGSLMNRLPLTPLRRLEAEIYNIALSLKPWKAEELLMMGTKRN